MTNGRFRWNPLLPCHSVCQAVQVAQARHGEPDRDDGTGSESTTGPATFVAGPNWPGGNLWPPVSPSPGRANQPYGDPYGAEPPDAQPGYPPQPGYPQPYGSNPGAYSPMAPPVSTAPIGASHPYASSGAPPPPVLFGPAGGAYGDPWSVPAPALVERGSETQAATDALAWYSSPERTRVARFAWTTTGMVIVSAALLFTLDDRWFGLASPVQRLLLLVGALLIIQLLAVTVAFVRQRKLFRLRRTVEEQAAAVPPPQPLGRVGLPRSSGPLELERLWVATQQRLDYYHQIATFQAETSFRNAQAAMIAGFLLVTISAVAATLARSTLGGVVAGILGGTGAAMAAYIGRTFVRAQETASEHLRSYFVQPLEISRVLAAVHLLDDVPAQQRQVTLTTIAQGIARLHGSDSSPQSDETAVGPAT
jgi:hypothetical protein